MSNRLKVRSEVGGIPPVKVVIVEGSLTPGDSNTLKTELSMRSGVKWIAVDLSRSGDPGEHGVAVMLGILEELKGENGRIVVIGDEDVATRLVSSGAHALIHHYPDREQAVASFVGL